MLWKRVLAVLAALALAGATMGQEGCSTEEDGSKDTGIDRVEDGGGEKAKPKTFKARNFSGSGSSNIGTIKIPSDGVLTWTNQGDPQFRQLLIYDEGFDMNVSSGAPRGRSVLPAGTYRNITVAGDDKWTITIKPR
jgi:hypothetical protein